MNNPEVYGLYTECRQHQECRRVVLYNVRRRDVSGKAIALVERKTCDMQRICQSNSSYRCISLSYRTTTLYSVIKFLQYYVGVGQILFVSHIFVCYREVAAGHNLLSHLV